MHERTSFMFAYFRAFRVTLKCIHASKALTLSALNFLAESWNWFIGLFSFYTSKVTKKMISGTCPGTGHWGHVCTHMRKPGPSGCHSHNLNMWSNIFVTKIMSWLTQRQGLWAWKTLQLFFSSSSTDLYFVSASLPKFSGTAFKLAMLLFLGCGQFGHTK